MRTYNFPISFAAKTGDTLCRVVLNARFTPRELIGDFPKKITSRYLNDVISRVETIATYVEAAGNAIDIVVREAAAIADADRAIVLNLLDFGQDYESQRSTTIDEVVFFVDNPEAMSVNKLLTALETANVEAGAFMTARLAEFPPDDDYLESSWPQDWAADQEYDWSGYYFFNFVLTYAEDLPRNELDFAQRFMDASHDVNMWNGYNPGQTAAASVASERDGLSFEVEAEGSAITYSVERTPCDPAFSVKRLAEVMHGRLGVWPESWDIRVEPED
ncbi:hypothetical protein [Afifella aestuarii]|uniref:hypothetical protein n=1 Tax=Afifella aestuarii TaxID=1909496 RepID=UPI000FE2F003|nr:hypothetical protein [Afifella aestuarii]